MPMAGMAEVRMERVKLVFHRVSLIQVVGSTGIGERPKPHTSRPSYPGGTAPFRKQ